MGILISKVVHPQSCAKHSSDSVFVLFYSRQKKHIRDGSLFMGMTGSDKKWPGLEKFRSELRAMSILKGKMTGF